jgi:CBS domain containing-hemolysin-like protein
VVSILAFIGSAIVLYIFCEIIYKYSAERHVG